MAILLIKSGTKCKPWPWPKIMMLNMIMLVTSIAFLNICFNFFPLLGVAALYLVVQGPPLHLEMENRKNILVLKPENR